MISGKGAKGGTVCVKLKRDPFGPSFWRNIMLIERIARIVNVNGFNFDYGH